MAAAVQQPDGHVFVWPHPSLAVCLAQRRPADQAVVRDDVLQHRVALAAEHKQRPQARFTQHSISS
eukprot:scaffold105974_cov32-Phaeocystis_antarctica.AAC.1